MPTSDFVPIVPGSTTGAQAAVLLNDLGNEEKLGVKSISSISAVATELNYWVDGTIVYARAEEVYYIYVAGTDTWDEAPIPTCARIGALTAGVLTKPTLTDNGNGTVTIGEGVYYLFSDNSFGLPLRKYTISGGTFTLTDGSNNYIMTDGGTPPAITCLTSRATINQSRIVPIYTIYREGTELHTIDWDEMAKGLSNKLSDRLARTERFKVEPGGLVISESATRHIDVTEGTVWYAAVNKVLAETHSDTDICELWYHTGGGGWTKSTITQYDNTQYDTGTGLAAVSAGRYVVNWVYRGIETAKHLFVVLGRSGTYKFQDASATTPPVLPAILSAQAILVGRIIVEQGASTAAAIQSAFDEPFVGVPLLDHNDLLNIQGGTTNEYYHLTSAQSSLGRFGGASDYTQFDPTTGRQTMAGLAKAWDDLRVAPNARTTGTNAPTFEKWFDDVAGTSRGVYLYSFDDVAAGSQKEVFFTMQMPHAWDGGEIHMHVHWVGNISDTTAAPYWGLEYCWAGIGSSYTDTTIVYTDGNNYTLSGTDANITAGKHYLSEWPPLVPPTGANTGSSILIARIFRFSSSVNDTYDVGGNKCGLMFIDAHFQINSLGSAGEYPPAP